jgi:hypothetical protein
VIHDQVLRGSESLQHSTEYTPREL